MFKVVKPYKMFETMPGVEKTPVVSIKEGDSVCHIVVEDGCYVCYACYPSVVDDRYYSVTHIFPELHEALCALPSNPEEID